MTQLTLETTEEAKRYQYAREALTVVLEQHNLFVAPDQVILGCTLVEHQYILSHTGQGKCLQVDAVFMWDELVQGGTLTLGPVRTPQWSCDFQTKDHFSGHDETRKPRLLRQ